MPVRAAQAWVTSALTNHDVERTLTLCHSLRRSHTSRKIVVIISSEISKSFRRALLHEFDLVVKLDEELNEGYVSMEDFAKVYAMGCLSCFEVCVYLSSTLLALKNPDEIFYQDVSSFRLSADYADTSLFLFKPSIHNFGGLVDGFKTWDKEMNLGKYIHQWQKSHGQTPSFLAGKYSPTKISFLRDVLELSDKNFVNISAETTIIHLDSTGIVGKLISGYWQKIQAEDVRPLVENLVMIPATVSKRAEIRNDPIAIVGMSCRYPGANNVNEFWELLFHGQDGISAPPDFRWLSDQSTNETGGRMNTNAGFLKTPIDEFDAKFFGISPKEAFEMDPQHRLLHELVWEGLEDACINPQELHGTSGSVFIGTWTNEYWDIQRDSGNTDFFRMYMGNSIGAAAARISFLLGITGPCIATDSGCSSAMVAIQLAIKSLRNGETNLALACGVNMLLTPFGTDHMPMMVSPDGHSRTFSENANGYARAEGGGVLILKRLSDALENGDHIWGLIRGSAMTQEGVSKSLGRPTVECESLAMTKALHDAGVLPEQVSYVEAHGTGTVVGDPMEVAAISKAYYSPNRKEPLVIGSVKTNVGHTESCSGITGIMKVVLAMQHETIPAHKNFSKLNPSIDLGTIPAVIPLQNMPWKRIPEVPRIAGISSFGITGTDAHLILEEPPVPTSSSALTVDDLMIMERSNHLLTLSAKTEEAMNALLENYKTVLMTSEDSIADIVYSANTGRATFPIRAAIAGKTKGEICEGIVTENYVRGDTTNADLGKICFLFPGQGSQYPGMAKLLYDTSPVFKMHFQYCDTIFQNMYHISVINILWSENNTEQRNQKLFSHSSLSLFCVEYALLRLWESWGVQPDYVLGHSFGEVAAAVCANIMSVEDALKMIGERFRLIDELQHGSMLVVKADQRQVEMAMKQFSNGDSNKLLDYAAINSSEQTVVAGDSDVVLAFSDFCKINGVKCTFLDANHAFHSKHMDPVLDRYRKAAGSILQGSSRSQTCGFISGLKGSLIPAEDITPEYWVRHIRDKVEFLVASKTAVELGCRTFIEIGPQPVLSVLTMINNPTNLLCLPSLKKKEDNWQTLLTSLAMLFVNGGKIQWKRLDQFRTRRKVRLPLYPFFGKKFWPEITKITGTRIHPLIGIHIPNPSSIKLFQNELSLKNEAHIADHAIGNSVIFPGAGYLEMCIAAGYATILGADSDIGNSSRAIKVENLTIACPLSLSESKSTHIQTTVETSTELGRGQWDETKVKIFRRVDTNDSWVEHASATTSTIFAPEELRIPVELVSIPDLLGMTTEDGSMKKIYQQLAAVGLNFGPLFQSCENMWINCGKSKSTVVKIKIPSDDVSGQQYILHPIILDAMVQAITFLKPFSIFRKKLHVPVKIGKFVFLAKEKCGVGETLYIQVYKNFDDLKNPVKEVNTTDYTTVLLNSSGEPIAIMSAVEFLPTTVNTIESVVGQQTKSMPDLWEEVWRHDGELIQYPMDYTVCQKAADSVEALERSLDYKKINIVSDKQFIFRHLYKLSYHSMLRALYECGWTPSVNQTVLEDEFIYELKIQPQFRQQVNYFLRVFEEEGILGKEGGAGAWRIIREPPPITQIKVELNTPVYDQHLKQKFRSTKLLMRLDHDLSKILQGTQSVSDILVSSESNGNEVKEFYREYAELLKYEKPCLQNIKEWLKEYKKQVAANGMENYVLKLLEIEAGTGAFTESLLGILEDLGIQYEYTFTNISTSSFQSVEKRLEKYGKHMKFKKMNLEEDPFSQGFIPKYYDIVAANLVIHGTKDLAGTMERVRSLLKTNGIFEMVELARECRFVTLLFGLLDEFWGFQDLHVPPDRNTVRPDRWVKLLESSGFHVVGKYFHGEEHICHVRSLATDTSFQGKKAGSRKYWLIFFEEKDPISHFLLKQFSTLAYSRDVVLVVRGDKVNEVTDSLCIRADHEKDFLNLVETLNKSDGTLEGIVYCWSLSNTFANQEDILRPFFFLAKSFHHLKQSAVPKLFVLTQGLTPVSENGLMSFHSSTLVGFTKSLRNETLNMHCKCIDIATPTTKSDLHCLFSELWRDTNEAQIAISEGLRFLPKLTVHKFSSKDLALPMGTDMFQLVLPETKSINDLRFAPLQPFTLDHDEIEIEVRSCALNFRDVFNVLKPSEEFQNSNAVGFDFAGVVKRVHHESSKWCIGDYVFGANFSGAALPSYSKLHQDDILPVPDDMTLNEACTLPTVAATSYHCLVDIAKIKRGDTVLIHTASGGVGLSAIEICKYFGANIIVTAGSKRKQAYLRSLGIEHVFHSRSTEYANKILEVTNGRGVDVVLNSLTSEGFKEASLRACAYGARFVEISKLSIWNHEDIQKLRPDVAYTVVDVSCMEPSEWRLLMTKVNELIVANVLHPIPYVTFSGVNIREALTYLQKAKHIGKVVCMMPEVRTQKGISLVQTPMFSNRGTYLITGGLGGIGLEVCKWMVAKGAKYILLGSRSCPNSKTVEVIDKLNDENGAKVKAVQLDVSCFKQCENLIHHEIWQMGYPKLRGIMHAAGALQDGFIENQSWDTLSSTLGPKVKGTLNLHELTKNNSQLEHFVLFSSVVALLGLPGQSNHSAGNGFEDALAQYRNSIGLPATSVNWGVWGEVGVATDADIPGIKPFSTRQGIAALEYALKSHQTRLAPVNIYNPVLLSELIPSISSYLDDHNFKSKIRKSTGQTKLKSGTFWQALDSAKSLAVKEGVLKDSLFSIFRSILKLDETDRIDENTSLQEMGVDSLMFMELRNALQTLLGSKVTINSSKLKEADNAQQILEYLSQLTEGA